MAESETPPTLASLRRATPSRKRPSAPSSPSTPSLFDALFPAVTGDGEGPSQMSPTADAAPIVNTATANSAPLSDVPHAVLPPSVSKTVPVISAAAPGRPSVPEDVPEPGATQPPPTWTVSGLVRHVRGLVEGGYAHVTVEGEISNWRPSGSGHCYFTLKDAGAQLTAVIFRRQAALLRFRPTDGDAVKIHGQLSIYESRGQLQLIVEWMQQAGLGALLAAVQRLKEQLRSEGLFDRKRPLPSFPHCIGVVTSLHGAALRDIVKVCRRRHASVQLLVYPAAVQGPNCAAEITAGLRWFNAHPDQAEVVLVARGGGSWEDLHGFNHEQVVRSIAGCVLPVITGIGHATDSTIADAAADVCAPTPSAAAELLTAAQHRVEDRVAHLQQRLLRAGNFELLRARQRFARLSAQTVLRRVEDALNRRAQRLDELHFRAGSALNSRLRAEVNHLRFIEARLARLNPAVRLQADRRRLENLQLRLERAGTLRLSKDQRRQDGLSTRLQVLSPLRVLDRGYALLYDAQGRLLRDATQTHTGQRVSAHLAKGSVEAEVVRILPALDT